MKTLKILPRDLVSQWYGDRPLDEDAVHDAVVEMMRRGWLPSFVPRPTEWDRNCVFLPQRSAFAAIVRYLDGSGNGVVPRGLIESRTRHPIACIGTGLMLSSIGIAIMRVDGNNVFIRSTTPDLALMIHSARLHPLEAMRTGMLINITTGKQVRPALWSEPLCQRVVAAFNEFQVDVPGVLEGKATSDVRSRWEFPSSPPPEGPSELRAGIPPF